MINITLNRANSLPVGHLFDVPNGKGRLFYNGGYVLKKGDVVKVYYDPVTQRKFEGYYIFIKVYKEDNVFYYCEVKLKFDGRILNRKILKKNI